MAEVTIAPKHPVYQCALCQAQTNIDETIGAYFVPRYLVLGGPRNGLFTHVCKACYGMHDFYGTQNVLQRARDAELSSANIPAEDTPQEDWEVQVENFLRDVHEHQREQAPPLAEVIKDTAEPPARPWVYKWIDRSRSEED